jgi:hypothetical protein
MASIRPNKNAAIFMTEDKLLLGELKELSVKNKRA